MTAPQKETKREPRKPDRCDECYFLGCTCAGPGVCGCSYHNPVKDTGIKTMRLFRASLPHFTCGLLVGDMGIVMEAAPIAKWAEGRPLKYFRDWAEYRCGTVEEVL